MTTETDDIPHTWEAVLPLLIAMYERGDDNKRFILSQFMSMAREADMWRAHVTPPKTTPQ